VSFDDQLPQVICVNCLELLKTSCELRKLIRSSDIVLRKLLDNEILTEDQHNILIVQENDENDLDGAEIVLIEPVYESSEEIAEWILHPKQKSPQPEVDSTPHETVNYCCMCKNVYSDFELLKQHVVESHKRRRCLPTSNFSYSQRKFDCNICSKKFNTEYLLKKHQRAFQNLVACAICGATTLPKNARSHAERHNNDLVECDVCHKMFKKVGFGERI
jgi:hypothetical protein